MASAQVCAKVLSQVFFFLNKRGKVRTQNRLKRFTNMIYCTEPALSILRNIQKRQLDNRKAQRDIEMNREVESKHTKQESDELVESFKQDREKGLVIS